MVIVFPILTSITASWNVWVSVNLLNSLSYLIGISTEFQARGSVQVADVHINLRRTKRLGRASRKIQGLHDITTYSLCVSTHRLDIAAYCLHTLKNRFCLCQGFILLFLQYVNCGYTSSCGFHQTI